MPHPRTAGCRIEEGAQEKAGDERGTGPLLALDFARGSPRRLEGVSGAGGQEAFSGSALLVEGLAALEEAAERNGNARCLILHDARELGLARLLEQGLASQEALEDWCAQTARLLAFLRRFRRRTWLVDRSAFLHAPRQALLQLGALDPSEGTTARQQEAVSEPDPLPDPLARLVAVELLRRHREAGALAGELAASTTPLVDGEPAAVDLDSAYRDVAERRRAAATAEPERPPQPGTPDLRDELAELREEHAAVLEQLLTAQEVAEKQRRRAQEAERWLAKRNAKLEWIYASRTYRATLPLRWLGMKLGGKKPGNWSGNRPGKRPGNSNAK